jgi:hypothetical protein
MWARAQSQLIDSSSMYGKHCYLIMKNVNLVTITLVTLSCLYPQKIQQHIKQSYTQQIDFNLLLEAFHLVSILYQQSL